MIKNRISLRIHRPAVGGSEPVCMVQIGSYRQLKSIKESMNTDRSFLGKLRQQFLELCMEREIFNKIFPHLNREQDHGYSFGSDEELLNEIRQGAVAVRTNFNLIERLARQMPKAYGEAFRYIVQRDLNHRMQMYLKLARRRVQQKTCDPRFVAVKA